MTAGPKPAPPTFSVGDRVTLIDRDGRPTHVDTIDKVLAQGAHVRTAGGTDYIRSKGRQAIPVYAWNARYHGGTLRAWQEGDEKSIALADTKRRRTDIDGAAKRSAASAERSWEIVTLRTTDAKADEARAAHYAAERDRLDAEIAELEGGGL